MTDAVVRDPFHRALKSLIDEEIATATTNLAAGSAARVSEETVSVAEKYAAQVSRIATLHQVLELCHAIETNQNELGPRAAKVKVTER